NSVQVAFCGENVLVSCWNPATAIRMSDSRSDVGVAVRFRFRTGMREGAVERIADGLAVAPDHAGLEVVLARLPRLLALGQLRFGDLAVQPALHRVDLDDVTVLQQRDRPANGRLRPDVADAEAARAA